MIPGIVDIRMSILMHLVYLPQVQPASTDAIAQKPSSRAEWTCATKKGAVPIVPDCILVAGVSTRPESHLARVKGVLAPHSCLTIAIASVLRMLLICCSQAGQIDDVESLYNLCVVDRYIRLNFRARGHWHSILQHCMVKNHQCTRSEIPLCLPGHCGLPLMLADLVFVVPLPGFELGTY